MMNHRVKKDRKQQEHSASSGMLKIRGIYVVRLLVCSLVALNVLLFYAIFFSSRGLPGFRNQNAQVKELDEKTLRLKQENQQLFDMIQALKNDPKAQEKLVRQELGWVRENEVVLEFPPKESERGMSNASKSTGPAAPAPSRNTKQKSTRQ